MKQALIVALRRLRQKLWVRPALYALNGLVAVVAIAILDQTLSGARLPYIDSDTVEKLLSVIAASMLTIATFAVGAMIAAYASASSTATPRSFTLVVADDVSQKALSSFVGAFIFSIVGIAAIKTRYYGSTGIFFLFCLTLLIFAFVVVTMVRWFDSIARLGRMRPTIALIERATMQAFSRRNQTRATAISKENAQNSHGVAIYSEHVGYVQSVDLAQLQHLAEQCRCQFIVLAVPGTFVAPGKNLGTIRGAETIVGGEMRAKMAKAFTVGSARAFHDDPRFGLITLSEIAARALSPGINDPGSAIEVIGTLVRIFVDWDVMQRQAKVSGDKNDRVHIQALEMDDLFEDAFTAIERDGASKVEVGIRLQKAYLSLISASHERYGRACELRSWRAWKRVRREMTMSEDCERIRRLALLVRMRSRHKDVMRAY